MRLTIEEATKTILAEIGSLDVDFIYVFGSYAKEEVNESSDLDIAFYSNKEYDSFKVFLLAQNISKSVKREVDLIQLKNSSTVFQKEVVVHGKVIYERDASEREKFEMLVFKKYARLNEERMSIIKNYGVDL